MDRFVIETSVAPPITSSSRSKSYFCPYCKKLIMKGNVQRLNLVCHGCYKMINADANDLLGA